MGEAPSAVQYNLWSAEGPPHLDKVLDQMFIAMRGLGLTTVAAWMMFAAGSAPVPLSLVRHGLWCLLQLQNRYGLRGQFQLQSAGPGYEVQWCRLHDMGRVEAID